MVICEETFLTDFGEINAFEVQYFSSSNIEWHAGRLSSPRPKEIAVEVFPCFTDISNNLRTS